PSADGKIVAQGGGFNVLGSHTYTDEFTNHTFTVLVQDVDGATTSASASLSVADAPLTATSVNVTTFQGVPLNQVVATFTDANPLGVKADFTATIDWGDGTSPTAGTIGVSGNSFTVTGSHAYGVAKSYTATVTINDVGGASATTSFTVTL